MLSLNVQIGKNPLEKHKPIHFKAYQQIKVPYIFTVGEDGQIVAWERSCGQEKYSQLIDKQMQNPIYTPVYYMIPSLNGDQQKCVSLIVTQLRLINKQQKTYKMVTYHTDNRLRIWQVRDGTCINISSHNFFSQRIVGLCENTVSEARFVFAFSQNSVFIVDCWTMKVIEKLQPKKQVYSQFLKGRLNQKRQLQLYDNYHISYKLDVSKLFKQTFIDVGRTINSLQKVQRQLKQVAQSLLQQKLVLFHKVWKTEDYKAPLKSVIQSQKIILKKQNTICSIFDEKLLISFPQIIDLLPQIAQITIQNFFFIKGTHLWYFIGTSQGKIYGFPAIRQRKQYIIVKDESNFHSQRKNSVRYLNLVDNLLVASWEDGNFKVYRTDKLPYMIDQEIYQRKSQSPEGHTFDCVSLEKLQIYRKKLSTSIKYSLPIYVLSSFPNVTSTKLGSQEQAFQLQNNEIVIFDSLQGHISHFVGIQEKKRVYVVAYLSHSNEYVGVSTEDGIQVFGPEGYERRIQYKDWEWKQWNMVERYESRKDRNNFDQNHAKGLELIQFANRHTINQIEYTSSTSVLLQQTFGLIDTQHFTNQLYSKFYFLDRSQVQKSLHSHSSESYTGVLKHKHNTYRRDKFKNTSFFINSSLNKQLDAYSSKMSDDSLQQTIEKNYVFYSSFLWDLFEIPFLTPLVRKLNKTFALKRRYASQGIGKTFTVYFDLDQSIFGLSKYLLTEYAITAISFMQCYVLKQIQKADELVAIVQYFTLNPKRSELIYISGQILSKSIISSSQNIVKACINLLISTIIAGHVSIHPLYEYFVLNLKNLEQKKQLPSTVPVLPSSASKNASSSSAIIPHYSNQQNGNSKQLREIQCEWMLYLGLGVIYGKGSVQKQQVKMLLNRIVECIQLNNYIKNPDLVQVVLKLLNQGLNQTWKQHLSKQAVIRLYLDLFRIFFYYDGIGNISAQDKKFNFCFQKNSQQQIKRMKQSIIKSIVYLSKQFNTEFIQSLTTQSVNQKPHIAYPASVIQIMRQYMKSQRPTSYLVFYIQLLLQCLSPMTPNLRKYVQKSVISTLQLMCTYKSISFNQSSQRLSIKSNNHLYIYCLRTSTKWRTISLLNEEGKEEIQGVRDQDCVLQMSTKGNYIALMTYQKLYIWRLSSGFWSGILGAFSQRLTFDLPKSGKNINIEWDLSQCSITVVNQDPSLNIAFKV